MTRRSLVVLVLAVVALAGARTSARQSVDDIVAKNLQAKGGLEKMRAVQTIKQTSHVNIIGLGDATITTYGKRPNMTRQEMVVAGKTSIAAFDGQSAWMVDPVRGIMTPTVIPGPSADTIKEQSDFDGPLVDYKAKGYSIELVGIEGAGDRRAYHLKLTSRDLRIQHCYVDVVTNLETRTVAETPMGALETQLSDYRDVDGLKFAFTVRSLMAGAEQGTQHLDKVELNVKLDDALFRIPKGL
jgi:outer membrane lipoprotein-sorting protein